MKYIVFQDSLECEYMILFPETLNHSDVANAMSRLPTLKPISAGKAHIGDDCCPDHYCHDRSVTLKLESRPEDSRLLERTLKNY